ncbi:MAG: homoserine dehydrogenase [Oscillospiraceae bacterium]|nr:homoserine dehydrogenase [Oscillospiraceae bacterium]
MPNGKKENGEKKIGVVVMNIGLLGFGTVGKGVYDITATHPDLQVTRVLCRRDLTLPDAQVTHDFYDILNDESIDTVVEVLGGLHPAWDYVKAAILAGKNVVTANKALVNHFYDELIPLVEQSGVKFRCTAAVGGGIGWLTELERVKRIDTLSKVGGIMNGTCNYILDNMTTKGLDYGVALKQAQELGYAEADPSADVDGPDTWNKTIISANIAFDVSLDKTSVPVCGIRNISAVDVAEFTKRGYVCKMIGTAEKGEHGISAYVQPTLVPNGEPAAAVPMNYNLISMVGSNSGPRSLFGQGAGRYPTAYNVVQDCVDVLNGVGFYASYGQPVAANNDVALSYYVRGASDAWLEGNVSESWGEGVLTKPVAVAEMHAWLKQHPDAFIAAVN